MDRAVRVVKVWNRVREVAVEHLTVIQAWMLLDAARDDCERLLSGSFLFWDVSGFGWVTGSGATIMYFMEPQPEMPPTNASAGPCQECGIPIVYRFPMHTCTPQRRRSLSAAFFGSV